MSDSVYRIRFTYSKRGRTCFIPHVVLPQVFYRSLRRAGMKPLMSQGFSPRPRITLGPALPVGIVALEEPAEVWFGNRVGSFVSIVNEHLPEGLEIGRSIEVEGASLNKKCGSASYLLVPRDASKVPSLFLALNQAPPFEESILSCSRSNDFVSIVLSNPGGFGPSVLIKYFKAKEIIQEWSDICLVRSIVGEWNGSAVRSLIEEDR